MILRGILCLKNKEFHTPYIYKARNMIAKTSHSHSLIVWCCLVGTHFIIKPLIRKIKIFQTRQPGKWVSFPNDLRVIENILHQSGVDWTRLIYVIVMAFLLGDIKKNIGRAEVEINMLYTGTEMGPRLFLLEFRPCFGGGPSKIEVIWVPGVYRTNCYYAMFCWKCLLFFVSVFFFGVYGTQC